MSVYETNHLIGIENRKQGNGRIVPLPPNFAKTTHVSPQNSLGKLKVEKDKSCDSSELRRKQLMTNVAAIPKKHVPIVSKERILQIEDDFNKSLQEQIERELSKTKGVNTVKHLTYLNDEKMKTINEYSNAKGNNRSKKVHRDEYILNRYIGKKGHH